MITINKLAKLSAELVYYFFMFFFTYTAIHKLANLESFRRNLIKTSLFTPATADVLSWLIIALELSIVAILFLRRAQGFVLLSISLLMFTVYISYLHAHGLYEVCGCGGIMNGLSYYTHFIINICLIFSYLFATYVYNKTDLK